MRSFNIRIHSDLNINTVISDLVDHLNGKNSFSLYPNLAVTEENVKAFVESRKGIVADEHVELLTQGLIDNFKGSVGIYNGTYMRRLFNDNRGPLSEPINPLLVSPSLIEEIKKERDDELDENGILEVAQNVVDQVYSIEQKLKNESNVVTHLSLMDTRYTPSTPLEMRYVDVLTGRGSVPPKITGFNIAGIDGNLYINGNITSIDTVEELDYYYAYASLFANVLAETTKLNLDMTSNPGTIFLVSGSVADALEGNTGNIYVINITDLETIDQITMEHISYSKVVLEDGTDGLSTGPEDTGE